MGVKRGPERLLPFELCFVVEVDADSNENGEGWWWYEQENGDVYKEIWKKILLSNEKRENSNKRWALS